MEWLLRKVDTLTGAFVAGAGGAAASQLQAFILQYLQRLGGHVDEARRAYDAILTGERYQAMAAPARDLIAQDALGRLNDLEGARDAIQEAGLLTKPFAFIAHIDLEVARGTWQSFAPVLPVDLAGLLYAGMGLVAGLVLYEIAKAPLRLLRRRDGAYPPRR